LPHALVVAALMFSAGTALARPRPPGPPYPEAGILAAFRFDNANQFTNTYLVIQNVALVESFSGYALSMQGDAPKLFFVPAVEPSGKRNFNPTNGTIRFWVMPSSWSSVAAGGAGPGTAASLFEIGTLAGQQSVRRASLLFSPTGDAISFVVGSQGECAEVLTAQIQWQAGEFHQIALSYSTQGSWLFLDSQLVASGAPVALAPAQEVGGTFGFCVGSDLEGIPSQAQFDELTLFSSVQGADDIAWNWTCLAGTTALGPISEEEEAARLQRFAANRGFQQLGAGRQMEMDSGMGPPPIDRTNNPAAGTNCWTWSWASGFDHGTNLCFWSIGYVVTNQTTNLYLAIANAEPTNSYDLYSATNLNLVPILGGATQGLAWNFLTNFPPGCTNLTFSNLTETVCFYALAVHQDSDGDGLSDGEEIFLFRTDPNNADCDGDGLPDGWEWKYFGNFDQTADGDYDGDGVSNLQEYLNGTDPNKIAFTSHFGYGSFATCTVTGAVDILGGVPALMAVLVDSDDFRGAIWQSFNAAPVVTLPAIEGGHEIWIGLKGRAPDSSRSWSESLVRFDQTPPTITVIKPLTNLVNKPIIQVEASTDEPLWSVSCTISNAGGVFSNIDGSMNREDHFKIIDLDLATGTNLVTLFAKDIAGNIGSTSFPVTLDLAGDTNPPVLSVFWPCDGDSITSDALTLRGQMDDETAAVIATVVGSSGTTNTIKATVERNGAVWAEDVPLEAGTNYLLLRATDAAGNTSETNLTFTRSDLTITIDDVPEAQLNDPTVTVSGTISATGYKVWVNGKAADMDGTSWTSSEVPVTSGSTAVFAVTAIPLSDNNGNGTPPSGQARDAAALNPTSTPSQDRATQPVKPPELKLINGQWERYEWKAWQVGLLDYEKDVAWRWNEVTGGYLESFSVCSEDPPEQLDTSGLRYWLGTNNQYRFEQWVDSPTNVVGSNYVDLAGLFGPGFSLKGPWAKGFLRETVEDIDAHYEWKTLATNVAVVWRTGGRQGVRSLNLHSLTAAAYDQKRGKSTPIPATSISIPGFKSNLGPDGRAFAVLADNEEVMLTPSAPSDYFTFSVTPTKHVFTSFCTATNPANRARTVLGVGEEVAFSFAPQLPIPLIWTVSEGGVSTRTNWSTTFTAPSNAAIVTVMASARGATLTNIFTVLEPTGVDHAQLLSTESLRFGVPAAGMYLRPFMAPTSVSFYRIKCKEVGLDATNVWGFYLGLTNPPSKLSHLTHGAGTNDWIPIMMDNSWHTNWDHAAWENVPGDWAPGGFKWIIPGRWKFDGGPEQDLPYGWVQEFSVDESGTMTVQKFGHTVRRALNGQYILVQ
jgi:hypothetical protein